MLAPAELIASNLIRCESKDIDDVAILIQKFWIDHARIETLSSKPFL